VGKIPNIEAVTPRVEEITYETEKDTCEWISMKSASS
jgi:hypothetical protein